MAGEIEFLTGDVQDEPAVDRPRRNWAVRGAALAVVLIALIAWIVTRPSGLSQPVAAPSSSESTAPSGPTPAAPDTRVRCTTGAPAKDVAQAMHKFLPSIAVDTLASVRCVRGVGETSRIQSESVSGSYRGLTITVNLNDVNAAHPILDAPTGVSGSRRAAYESMGASLHVTVLATGPPAVTPPEEQMRQLGDYLGLYVLR